MKRNIGLAIAVCALSGCGEPSRPQPVSRETASPATNTLTGEQEDPILHLTGTPRYQLVAAPPLMFRIDTFTGRAWYFSVKGWNNVKEPIPGLEEPVVLSVPNVGEVSFPGSMSSVEIGNAYRQLTARGATNKHRTFTIDEAIHGYTNTTGH